MRTLWRCYAAGLAALLGAWLLPATAIAQVSIREYELRYAREMYQAKITCDIDRFDHALRNLKALAETVRQRAAREMRAERDRLSQRGYKGEEALEYQLNAQRAAERPGTNYGNLYQWSLFLDQEVIEREAERQKLGTFMCPYRPVRTPGPLEPTPVETARGLELLISAVGGSTSTTSSGKTLRSTDTLRMPDPTVAQNLDSTQSQAAGGVLATIDYSLPGFGLETYKLGARIGVIASGKAPDQPVSDPTGVPRANGTINDPPRLTVPLHVGVSVPTSMFGLNVPGLSAEFFAGANINQRHASISLVELGAGPLGRPVTASETWTSVDPALSVGLQYLVGSVGAFPVSVGTTVMFDWARSHTIVAPSPNFASQSYMLETGRQRDTMVMLNLSIGLGGGASAPPAPPRAPMYVKAPPLK